MGSGTTKKFSDTPRLRSTAIGTGGPSSGESSNNLCPEQFNIPFEHPHAIMFAGRRVKVTNGKVAVGGTVLCTLNNYRMAQLNRCEEGGVTYTGVVIEHKQKYYVQFSRRIV